MRSATVENSLERDAMMYLADQAYSAMLGHSEPVRSAEISGSIGKEQYSAKLFRHVLGSSSRFTQIDRRWDLEIRYEDKQRPMERVLVEIIKQYGRPMTVSQIANELCSIYERTVDYYETMAPRMMTDPDRYFQTSDGLYGIQDWILNVTSSKEDNIIFDNDMDEAEIESLASASAKVDWGAEDFVGTLAKFAEASKAPVNNKYAQLLRWRVLGDSFDALQAFEDGLKDTKLVWLSDGRWATSKMAKDYDAFLMAEADKLAEEVAEEIAPTAAAVTETVEEAAPVLTLTISDRDLDEVAEIITSKGSARMPVIIETIFEISPRDSIYATAAEGLGEAMRADSRFLWVGGERWRMDGTVPENVKETPASLEIAKLDFETMDGDQLEVELDDEGLEGGLATEVHSTLVQDVHDQDEDKGDAKPVDSVRCVVARHHKLLGTFPVCAVPRGLLPTSPSLCEITLISGDKKVDAWVNRETGLIYGIGELYPTDMPECGAVFGLKRTDNVDEFLFVYEEKTDKLTHVAPGRIEELLEMAEDSASMSTLDIVLKIMAFHKKGAAFATLFAEVNIVRRTSRRLVASILSSYYGFVQRTKSDLWSLDEKKIDQGFKKVKKKYIRK